MVADCERFVVGIQPNKFKGEKGDTVKKFKFRVG
jgi:hypothetical protein